MTDTPDRDALIERVAEAFHGHLRNNVAAGTLQDYTRGARAVLALLEAEGRLRQPRRRPQPGETVIETEFARVVAENDQLRRDLDDAGKTIRAFLPVGDELVSARAELANLRAAGGSLWVERRAEVEQLRDEIIRLRLVASLDCTSGYGCPATVHAHGCRSDDGDCTEPGAHLDCDPRGSSVTADTQPRTGDQP